MDEENEQNKDAEVSSVGSCIEARRVLLVEIGVVVLFLDLARRRAAYGVTGRVVEVIGDGLEVSTASNTPCG